MQDLERQMQALEGLKSTLMHFMEQLAELSASYNSNVNSLKESGLTVQIADNYANTYQQRNTEAISNLIRLIEEEDLPYVNRNIEALTDLIERTRAN